MWTYQLFKNITPEEVLIANGNIVTAEEGGNVSLTLSAESTQGWRYKTTRGSGIYGHIEPGLKITLKGPRYNTPGDKSFKPVTFRLYADKSKSKLLYEFKLMRWYIAQPEVSYSGTDDGVDARNRVKDYCQSLGSGYRLPEVNEYTNSNYPAHGWRGGVPGRNENTYRRQLSYLESATKWQGGIFNEWGCLVNNLNAEAIDSIRCSGYPGSDWDVYEGYWSDSVAKNATGSDSYNGKGLMIWGSHGITDPYDQNSTYDLRAACVAP